MKILFAVSNENISEAIAKHYQKEYKEILSYKNVYYFNAILKEVQRDKTYDRIIISEELEPFSNNNYDSIDKFIIEKLTSISEYAINNDGKNIPIIFICTDRINKGAPILVKLFNIGVYNALIGQERSIEQVSKLIVSPREKQDAKAYYKINVSNGNEANEAEGEVNESEIQNILNHYKRLGRNQERYADSFNNIAAQYTDAQLRVIIKCLPINVRAVLEVESPKYQELITFSEKANKKDDKKIKEEKKIKQAKQEYAKAVSEKNKYEPKPVVTKNLKIDVIENSVNRPKMTSPVIIPSNINTGNVRRVQSTTQQNPNVQRRVVKVAGVAPKNARNVATNQNMNNTQQIQRQPVTNVQTASNYQMKQQLSNQVQNVTNAEQTYNTQGFETNNYKENVEPVKRGRGRPKKEPIGEVVEKPKGKRGRPKKNALQETLPEFEDVNLNEETMLPGMGFEDITSNEETMLPGMGFEEPASDEETMLPGMEYEDTSSNEETMLPGMEYEDTSSNEETMLPGMGFEEPASDEETMLPGMEYEDASSNEETMLPGMGFEESASDEETMLPGMEYEDTSSNEETMLPGMEYEEPASDEETMLPGMNFENSELDRKYSGSKGSSEIETIKPKIDYSMSSLNSVLTKDKKIVTFIGTTKNGTSFLVNNLAAMCSSIGIKTAILDMTKNRNAYYIYTNNDESLRKIAINSIEKLQNGFAEGIKYGKNLTVYTALPNDNKDYSNAEPILSTLAQNYSLILIDCDYDTDPSYFAYCQEIYLVQSMDILTIQPLTTFLKELKSKGILEPEKLKVVINKEIRVKNLSIKTIIGGLSVYNDPSMSFMTNLFNKDTIKVCTIPFEDSVYSKYLETMVDCNVSINGYSKNFISKLKILMKMVYPLLNEQSYVKSEPDYSKTSFSKNMNNTLNKMRKNY